jgi:hypothetical protein
VTKAAGKHPELHKRPPLSERALAARRMNALKGGRPAGGMNVDKLAFRDRFRAKRPPPSCSLTSTGGQII